MISGAIQASPIKLYRVIVLLRGGQSIQAKQLVFQSYYHLFAHKFSNGCSLRPFQGKDM